MTIAFWRLWRLVILAGAVGWLALLAALTVEIATTTDLDSDE